MSKVNEELCYLEINMANLVPISCRLGLLKDLVSLSGVKDGQVVSRILELYEV